MNHIVRGLSAPPPPEMIDTEKAQFGIFVVSLGGGAHPIWYWGEDSLMVLKGTGNAGNQAWASHYKASALPWSYFLGLNMLWDV